MEQYDIIVIGAGPGGYVSAIKAAQCGMNAALVESREIGGTCLNRGCIPTKSLIHAAGLFRQIQECGRFGLFTGQAGYDLDKIFAYKTQVVEKLRAGIEQLLYGNHVTVIHGKAKVQPDHTVRITESGGERVLRAENILIATGSVPAVPPIPGAQLPRVMTSDGVLDGEIRDGDRLVMIGGGVIGVEFASAFRSLGFEVTIIEALPSLLSGMDREISQNLKMILKKRGVNIYTAARVARITQGDALRCHFEVNGESRGLDCDAIIVATGRRANTDVFDAGFSVAMKDGRILVDDDFMTSEKGIYAIGDVTGRSQLAHAASAQGVYTIEKLSSMPPSVDLSIVPACVYTDPEIACVGLSADEAKRQNIPVRAGKFITSANGKSMITMEERGFIKVVFDEKSDVLLGAQMMCARATDMIGEMSTAIVNKLTARQLTLAMRAHPTYNESVSEAVGDATGKAIHIMPKR